MNATQGAFTNPLKETGMQQSGLLKTEHGFTFRDLNKNGKLDIYEDPRQPVEARIEDLLGQMSLEEKAGLLFINGATINADGSIEEKPGAPGFGRSAVGQIKRQGMTHFNLWQIPAVQVVAAWHNHLQRFAEGTRLGIPITIASDPRNHFNRSIFSMAATEFSQWCEPLGFAASGDAELVRRFAEIVRQEYLAVGIRLALHHLLVDRDRLVGLPRVLVDGGEVLLEGGSVVLLTLGVASGGLAGLLEQPLEYFHRLGGVAFQTLHLQPGRPARHLDQIRGGPGHGGQRQGGGQGGDHDDDGDAGCSHSSPYRPPAPPN